MKLLCSVSAPNRGTKSERKLVIKLLKRGIHPKAIFHDLYLRKKSGFFSQIDLIIALPQGLVCVEVKDYSGWLFGSGSQNYWTQILNYGKEKHRFYNPILQNEGHIKTLREQSEQFSQLPIYNIVLFTNACTLKDITYNSDIKYVGYTSDVMDVLKKISGFDVAKYTDKNEVVYILNEAVRRGDNPEIRSKHVEFIQKIINAENCTVC